MSAWYEIIVKGSKDALSGFVAGCEATLGAKEAALFGHDLDLEVGTFAQRLLKAFATGSQHLVFAPAGLAEEVVTALRSRGQEAGLELESVREVVRARMPFSAEAFSEDLAERIRQELLLDLPPGVEREQIEEREERDPGARRAELYTPEHEYIYRVAGALIGPLPGVVEMQRRAHDLPFVKVKPLELQRRPVETAGAP